MDATDPLTAALDACDALKDAITLLGEQRDHYARVTQDALRENAALKRAKDVHE